jgi:EAL domain-containing protein (putative c-di-GMP-specific phosphodiesterase class I)/GGDEF domain-containing protein
MRSMLLPHLLVAAAAIVAPLALQSVAPVSANLGLVLIAQTICAIAAVAAELHHRSEQIARQREIHLHHAALHDPETSLPNRRAAAEHINACQAQGKSVWMLAIGIERFPVMRGAIGYANANQVVLQLASRLQACADGAPVFHLSTSILGVALPCDEEEASDAVEKLIAKLDTTVYVSEREIETSIRVGAARAAVCDNAESLLEDATIALDLARLHRRKLTLATTEQRNAPIRQLALVSDVSRGLSRNEFSLLYQPKATLKTGRLVGAEALLRWRHPEHGDISPDHFIAAAEETGAIGELTRWVLERVIEDQCTLSRSAPRLPLAVNISARLLSDADFCRFACSTLDQGGAALCFEITESAIIEDPAAALAAIAAFRDAGIRISVDDYGSGLSSLAYLKQIAADELKLDKSLIRDVLHSARDRLILKSTIDLAHGLGMSVVAEGVEDDAARAVLEALGADYQQGFLVSRPVALEALTRFVVAGEAPARLQA